MTTSGFKRGVCTEDGKGIRLIGDEEYKEWVRHDLENLTIVCRITITTVPYVIVRL